MVSHCVYFFSLTGSRHARSTYLLNPLVSAYRCRNAKRSHRENLLVYAALVTSPRLTHFTSGVDILKVYFLNFDVHFSCYYCCCKQKQRQNF
jgi:hypothetical protein